MKRIAVTGAGGFTGRFVEEALSARGAQCVPLEADLCDAAAVEDEVRRVSFDGFIHLAARAFVNSSDWRGFYDVNQLGTYTLLESVARHRPGIRGIVVSSAQVYGPGAEGLIAEDAPARPANHYAVSKLAMEHGAALWKDRLDIVIARPFNYTGVGQGAEYLIPKIVDHFRRRAAVIELGNIWVKRDFGDVRSVAAAYADLVTAPSSPALVNICSGSVRSIDDVLAILTQMSGHRMEVQVNPAFVRENDVPVLGGDVTRLRAALPGWTPIDLQQTLEWMYRSDSARAAN